MRLPLPAALLAALAPMLASAADPADPAVAVPAPAYRSAFEGVPTGVEEGTVDWKKANADVGQFPRGHADILKWEQGQGGAAPAVAPSATPTPAAPPTAPARPAQRP